MKSQTLRSKMYELNLTSSYSRPRVSNDNPYLEPLNTALNGQQKDLRV